MASIKVGVGAGTGTDEIHSDSEMDGWWERKDHPLLNDVVLKILFQSMNGKDLKECRLVCKKWCGLSLPSARSKFSIKLNRNGAGGPRSVTDFVEVFKENKLGIPFVNYYLGPFCTSEGPGQEFLQICGNTAKKVYLNQPDSPVLETETCQAYGGTVQMVSRQAPPVGTINAEDIGTILKAMPNIEVFGIFHRIHSRSGNVVKLFQEDSAKKPTLNFLKTLFIFDYHKTSEYCPTFVQEILPVAPNVTDFFVRDLGSIGNDPEISRIGQVLKGIEEFERQYVIKNLNIFYGTTEHFESLRRLGEKGMELKHLNFLPIYETQNGGSLKFLPQLATLFRNSIEFLCVEEVCSSFIQLPHMPKLERLEFRISQDFDSNSVNLNKLFPALKALRLDNLKCCNFNPYELEEFLPNSEPCPNVKALSLFQVVFKIQLFDHILNIFPKLTRLGLDLKTDGEQILRKIMTEMTQLEDLTVVGEIEEIESIDALLTGIPDEKVKELEHFVPELKEMTVQLRGETIRDYRTRYCQFPSIANLTNLKKLHLSSTGSWDDQEGLLTWFTRMTDVFAYFGLYSMKHINKLEIRNCEFTKATCEILTVEMELEAWALTRGENGRNHIIPEVE